MGAKVWYVAAGKKKAGPMTSGRLRKQVDTGKVPDGALAWREGMENWEPVHEIDHLRGESAGDESGSESSSDSSAATAEETKLTKTKVESAIRRRATSKGSKLKSGSRKAPRPASKRAKPSASQTALELSFVPLHRVTWKDMFRAFGLGLEFGRIKLALTAMMLPALGAGLLLGMGLLASKLHMLLMVPFALAAPLAGYVLTMVAVGALSYYSRQQLQEQERPGVQEAIRWSLERASTMSVPPFLLSLSWLVPLIALGILAVMVKIPVVGPIGTGLLFGVHLALGAAVVFLMAAAAIAAVFGPVVAAFEETSVKATMNVLLDFVKRSLPRTILWGALPSMALTPFTWLLMTLGLIVFAIPTGMVFLTSGTEFLSWLQSGGMGKAPIDYAWAMVGLIGVWGCLLGVAISSVVVSVNNAVVSLLYLGGRAGNDDLITRDTYLARRAEERA